MLILGLISGADTGQLWSFIAQIIVAVVSVIWLLVQLVTLPLLVAQPTPSLRQAWHDAWRLTWRRPGISITLLLTLVTLAGTILLTQGMGFVLAGPALLALVTGQAVAQFEGGADKMTR